MENQEQKNQIYEIYSFNAGRLFIVLLIVGLIAQFNIHLLIYFSRNSEMNIDPIWLMAAILSPTIPLIIWVVFQKFKDTIFVTDIGLESKNIGLIKWNEIQFFSWESFRSEAIFVKLKSGKRYMITPQPTKSTHQKKIKHLFQEIKNFNQTAHLFDVKSLRFFWTFGLGFFAFLLLGALIAVIVY